MQVDKKDETFLILKHGPDYQATILDSWNKNEDVQFTDRERDIVLDFYRIAAGLEPKSSK